MGPSFGGKSEGSLPWTLISGMDAGATTEPLFQEESFAPILVETTRRQRRSGGLPG